MTSTPALLTLAILALPLVDAEPAVISFTPSSPDTDTIVTFSSPLSPPYAWNMDDGFQTTDERPSHRFMYSGVYYVTLTKDGAAHEAEVIVRIPTSRFAAASHTTAVPADSSNASALEEPSSPAAGSGLRGHPLVPTGIAMVLAAIVLFGARWLRSRVKHGPARDDDGSEAVAAVEPSGSSAAGLELDEGNSHEDEPLNLEALIPDEGPEPATDDVQGEATEPDEDHPSDPPRRSLLDAGPVEAPPSPKTKEPPAKSFDENIDLGPDA